MDSSSNVISAYSQIRNLGYVGVFQIVKYRIWKHQKIFIEDFYEHTQELIEQIPLLNIHLINIEWKFEEQLNLEILILNLSETEVQFQGEKMISLPKKIQETYWKTLRKWIGHSTVYSSSCVIVIEQNGKVLLVKRSDDGQWSLPAGAKEIGDTLEDTIHKEAWEEVGIQIFDLELIAIQTGKKMFWKYPNENQMHYISFVWKAKTLDVPKISDSENSAWQWLEVSEALKILEPRWKIRLEYFQIYNGKIILS
ncbi:MAG: NUDIX domain-containing protein [Leptospiraceae bacterium]|nr:NUDIX domain-containing protein [Leptospiraceae bacterium]